MQEPASNDEFLVSEERIRLWKSSTFIAFLALFLFPGMGLVLTGSGGLVLFSIPRIVIVLAFSSFVAFRVVPKMARSMRVQIDDDVLLFSSEAHEKQIPFESIRILRQTLDVAERTVALRVDHAGGKTYLAGYEDMDRLHDLLCDRTPQAAHITRPRRKRPERLLTTWAFWGLICFAVLLALTFAVEAAWGIDAAVLVCFALILCGPNNAMARPAEV